MMFFKLTRILLILSAIMLGGACSSDDPGTPHAEKHRAKILKYLHLKPDEKIADICFYSTETLKKREWRLKKGEKKAFYPQNAQTKRFF